MALRGLRGKEDITQAELAARLGISQNMVSDMESGKRNISLKMAKRIAEEFKVPYKAFL
jgi:transcriptional regulator with XRE-family HTH domain